MVTVGKKIKELREAKGISQKKLGEIMDINNCVICAWEKGRCEPRVFNCILLADIFGVSLDELCCRDFKGGK